MAGDRREPPLRWSWQGTVPATVVTAFIQVFSSMYSTYNNNKSTSEVVKRIDDLSHQVEILSLKQNAYEPRFVLIETQIRFLTEQINSMRKTDRPEEKKVKIKE